MDIHDHRLTRLHFVHVPALPVIHGFVAQDAFAFVKRVAERVAAVKAARADLDAGEESAERIEENRLPVRIARMPVAEERNGVRELLERGAEVEMVPSV